MRREKGSGRGGRVRKERRSRGSEGSIGSVGISIGSVDVVRGVWENHERTILLHSNGRVRRIGKNVIERLLRRSEERVDRLRRNVQAFDFIEKTAYFLSLPLAIVIVTCGVHSVAVL